MNSKKNSKKRKTGKLALIGTALGALGVFTAPNAQACNDTPYIGMICATAASFCPRGYAEANGALLPIASYQALFSLLGTVYGGDGRTTFGLPDLRGRTPVGHGTGPGLSPVTPGEKRGNERSVLATANLPAGGGGLQVSTAAGTETVPTAETYLSAVGVPNRETKSQIYSTDGTNLVNLKGAGGGGGAAQAFSNVPPQLGIRYCVALQGLFPPRN